MIEGIGVLIKLRLKDKTPPCVLSFKTGTNQMFKVFQSMELREPTEFSNHGSDINVSKWKIIQNLNSTTFSSYF